MRLVHEPEAGERGEEEPGEAGPGALGEQERGGPDGDERLHLLDHDRRDEVGVADQRVGEEDRRDGRGAGADDDGGRDVAPTGAEDRAQRGEEERKRAEHEDHVLAEDDRRRGRREAHRLPDDRIGAPHRRGDRDQDDPGYAREPHGRSKRRRSSTVSRARIRRASPSATSTTAGRGTPLYVEPSASV